MWNFEKKRKSEDLTTTTGSPPKMNKQIKVDLDSIKVDIDSVQGSGDGIDSKEEEDVKENFDPSWSPSGENDGKSKGPMGGKVAFSPRARAEAAKKTESGEVIYSGVLDFKVAKGTMTDDIAWEFSRLSALKGIPVSLVASSSTSVHSIIVTTAGAVYSWGRGGHGQLGVDECPDVAYEPVRVKHLKKHKITAAATGSQHSLVLTSNGDVYGFGANHYGQLGVGNYEALVPTPTRMLSKKTFVQIRCGSDFSMIVDSKGYLYSCGSAESGKLGHGYPKEIIEGVRGISCENENRARRLQRYQIKDCKAKLAKDIDDVKIVDVTCGAQHTLALDDRGRVFSWGFGGYGRLGHGSAADEHFPRLLTNFLGERRAINRIWAGANASLAETENGALLFWGQGRNEVVIPQCCQRDALKNKTLKSLAVSSNSVLLAADEELYTWSLSTGATLGQMGLTAEQKSSSSCVRVPLPPDVVVHSLACGHSSSLCVVGAKEQVDTDGIGRISTRGKTANKILDAFPTVQLKDLKAEKEEEEAEEEDAEEEDEEDEEQKDAEEEDAEEEEEEDAEEEEEDAEDDDWKEEDAEK